MKNQIKKNQRKQQKKSNTDSDVKKNPNTFWLKADILLEIITIVALILRLDGWNLILKQMTELLRKHTQPPPS